MKVLRSEPLPPLRGSHVFMQSISRGWHPWLYSAAASGGSLTVVFFVDDGGSLLTAHSTFTGTRSVLEPFNANQETPSWSMSISSR